MNINTSTGGPHLLLFERDQQFAALLTSELQLAGYTNHVARTAVEVFDAISRYPIRLVLVDLAQAAAARREFWVALDSQRRDRKVQVLTFVCTNLASYGPRDLEDHAQNTNVDLEIDGMLGLMSLVEAVRTRVPSVTIDTNTNTQPRMQRFSAPPTPVAPQPSMPMPTNGNSGSFHTPLSADTSAIQELQRSGSHFLPQTPVGQMPSVQVNQNPQPSPATGLSGSSQPSYSEKIRAVLYPNQRTWSTQEVEAQSASYEMKDTANSVMPAMQPTPPTQPISNELNASQRLSGGRPAGNDSAQGESGLAQLSRLVQGFRSPTPLKEDNNTSYAQPAPMQQQQSATQWPSTPAQQPATQWPSTPAQQPATQWSSTPVPSQPATQWPPTPAQQPTTQWSSTPAPQPTTPWSSTPVPQQPATPWSSTPVPQPTAPWSTSNTLQPPVEHKEPAQNQTHLNNPGPLTGTHPTYTQRDSVDTSHVRPVPPSNNAHSTLEPTREREIDQNQPNSQQHQMGNQQNQVHTYSTFVIPTARTNQEDKIGAQPLRASPIQDMPLERTVSGPAITEMPKRPDVLSRSNYGQTPSTPNNTAHLASIAPSPTPQAPIETREQPEIQYEQEAEPISAVKAKKQVNTVTTTHEEEKLPPHVQLPEELAESMTTNNAVLLDIVQSLPPMPALGEQPQSVQPQALNGRATRSLNKVLLDGHLVPQDRLDVAQNIQRMLSGVDLNYQLGEILLMFKLLTPDQLLAASLVSYGLITTTQISALGRIRQELYAIGLEYDLENLLIVFRILTTEQLREARSSLQS